MRCSARRSSGDGILADLGADVIKAEAPQGGDPERIFGLPGDQPDPERPDGTRLFEASNRGKRSVCRDIGAQRRARHPRAVGGERDVFLTNMRTETIHALAIDDGALRSRTTRSST